MGLPFAGRALPRVPRLPRDVLLARLSVGVASHPGRRVDVLRHHARAAELLTLFQLGHADRPRRRATFDHAGSRPWSLAISIDGVLDWRVDIKTTPATRLMSAIGSRLPAAASKNRRLLAMMSHVVGPLLGIGRMQADRQHAQRPGVPHRAETRMGGRRLDRRRARARTSDRSGRYPAKGNLGDFHLPQRGICVVAQGRFEPFDIARHRDRIVLTYPADPPRATAQNRRVTSGRRRRASDPRGSSGGAVGCDRSRARAAGRAHAAVGADRDAPRRSAGSGRRRNATASTTRT